MLRVKSGRYQIVYEARLNDVSYGEYNRYYKKSFWTLKYYMNTVKEYKI